MRGDFFACLSKDLGDISGIPDKWRGNIWKSQTSYATGWLFICVSPRTEQFYQKM